jgi:hypothetical protein
MLIPTLYKVKLSKQLSYPIGAELLSEHLADPVQRQLKHIVQQALVSQGLPAVRDSVIKHHPANQLRDVEARILFSPSTQTVYFREWVNEKESKAKAA